MNRMFYLYKTDGLWWFRIFGYGISWQDTRKRPLLFAKRNKYNKGGLNLGRWHFAILTPTKSREYYENRK